MLRREGLCLGTPFGLNGDHLQTVAAAAFSRNPDKQSTELILFWPSLLCCNTVTAYSSLQDLTLLLRLKCSGTIVADCSLDLLGSSNPPMLASQVTGTAGTHHHTQLIIFLFFVEMTSHYVAKSDSYSVTRLECMELSILAHCNLRLLGSSDSPALASQLICSLYHLLIG
ncbi:Protein PPP5D1 [Plecturocebus cupreus]